MGKKYLETKNGTLESSILGVWRAAAAVKEEPETINGSGEHAFEVGTDRYAEYTKKITPGQIEEAFILLDEQQLVLGEGTFTEEQCKIIEALREMTDEEHDELLEQMDDDQLEMYEGILGKIGKAAASAAGKGLVKTVKRFGTAQGRADAALKKQQKKATLIKTKKAASALKKKNVTALKKKAVPAKKKAPVKKKAVPAKKKAPVKKKPAGLAMPGKEEAELGENGTHVNPKDRDELDKEADAKGGAETAKRMKKAKEPEPNQMAETNKNDKSDDGEGLDAVQPKAVKKKFKDRKDKDIDNDGDTDDSDKFLHKKRKAISKAMAKEEVDLDENAEEYAQTAYFKIQSMKDALAKVWGMEEGYNPFAEHKGTKPHKHPHEENEDEMVKGGKTETGKKAAVIDLKPKIKD